MKPYILLSIAILIVAFFGLLVIQNHRLEQIQQRKQDAFLARFLTPSHSVRITRQITDERGLTSIMFTQDGEEWGLDYCTKKEIDSLKAIK